jgi:hypothetical protein
MQPIEDARASLRAVSPRALVDALALAIFRVCRVLIDAHTHFKYIFRPLHQMCDRFAALQCPDKSYGAQRMPPFPFPFHFPFPFPFLPISFAQFRNTARPQLQRLVAAQG